MSTGEQEPQRMLRLPGAVGCRITSTAPYESTPTMLPPPASPPLPAFLSPQPTLPLLLASASESKPAGSVTLPPHSPSTKVAPLPGATSLAPFAAPPPATAPGVRPTVASGNGDGSARRAWYSASVGMR